MLLFSVICCEFLPVVRLHLVKLFFPRKTKKKSLKSSAFFLSRHLPGEKFIQLNKHVLQAIYNLPLITFHTNICPNLVVERTWFFWVHCRRFFIARRGEIAKRHAIGLKKQFGMGELRSFGGWPSKIEVIGALGMVSKLNMNPVLSQLHKWFSPRSVMQCTFCSNQS